MSKQNESGIPKYRRQRGRNREDRAFVEVRGKRVYLGPYGSPESHEAYQRAIGDLARSTFEAAVASDGLTVNEVMARYFEFALTYYRRPDGSPTSEIEQIRLALRPLRKLFGSTPADDFGPRSLKLLRADWIEQGVTRKYINKHIDRIKRMFKWAASEELVDASVFHGLQTVAGLRRGRTEARESAPVRPVDDDLVDAVRPYVSDQVWAIIELQRLTGARPGEILIMRAIDLDTSNDVWIYTPSTHKNAYREQPRSVYLGPRAQDVVLPFLEGRAVDAYVFSPADAEQDRRAAMHEARATPMNEGNRPGTNKSDVPKRPAGDHYRGDSYRRAITRACEQAFPPPERLQPRVLPNGKRETQKAFKARLTTAEREELAAWHREHHWHPHQLRHSVATKLRKQYGLEAAQIILGHARADVTQVYAETNTARAIEIAAQVG